MKSILILINFTLITAFICSCKTENKNATYSIINSTLLNDRAIINKQTEIEFEILKEKTKNPAKVEIANRWFKVAADIRTKNLEYLKLIDSLKSFNYFDNAEKSNLLKTLNLNRHELLESNKEIEFYLNSNTEYRYTPIDKKLLDLIVSSKNEEKLLLINSQKNEIIQTENKLIAFCNSKAELSCNFAFNTTSFLVGQNSNHFKKGEILEITAGMGSYTVSGKPKIEFNGIASKIENGFSTYRIIVSDKFGKNSIPIKVEYTNQTGEKVVQNLKVEYYTDQ